MTRLHVYTVTKHFLKDFKQAKTLLIQKQCSMKNDHKDSLLIRTVLILKLQTKEYCLSNSKIKQRGLEKFCDVSLRESIIELKTSAQMPRT